MPRETARITLVMSGCHEHPGDMTPIEERYSEEVRSTAYPVKSLVTISAPTEINFGHLRNPRLVIVTNRAGSDEDKYPTEEQAAELAKQQVYIGPVECPRLCLLHPRMIGYTLSGGSQAFWLAPGQRLVLSPADGADRVPVRILAFPGSEA